MYDLWPEWEWQNRLQHARIDAVIQQDAAVNHTAYGRQAHISGSDPGWEIRVIS
jgi:hypothetical protein